MSYDVLPQKIDLDMVYKQRSLSYNQSSVKRMRSNDEVTGGNSLFLFGKSTMVTKGKVSRDEVKG